MKQTNLLCRCPTRPIWLSVLRTLAPSSDQYHSPLQWWGKLPLPLTCTAQANTNWTNVKSHWIGITLCLLALGCLFSPAVEFNPSLRFCRVTNLHRTQRADWVGPGEYRATRDDHWSATFFIWASSVLKLFPNCLLLTGHLNGEHKNYSNSRCRWSAANCKSVKVILLLDWGETDLTLTYF